jgi:hypothetical protein
VVVRVCTAVAINPTVAARVVGLRGCIFLLAAQSLTWEDWDASLTVMVYSKLLGLLIVVSPSNLRCVSYHPWHGVLAVVVGSKFLGLKIPDSVDSGK